MGLSWRIGLPGPFSVGGRVGGSRRSSTSALEGLGLLLGASALLLAGGFILAWWAIVAVGGSMAWGVQSIRHRRRMPWPLPAALFWPLRSSASHTSRPAASHRLVSSVPPTHTLVPAEAMPGMTKFRRLPNPKPPVLTAYQGTTERGIFILRHVQYGPEAFAHDWVLTGPGVQQRFKIRRDAEAWLALHLNSATN